MELWRKLHLIADRAEPKFQLQFLRAIMKAQPAVNQSMLIAAIKTGNPNLAWQALNWDKVMRAEVDPALRKAIYNILKSAGTEVMRDLIGAQGSFNVQFPQVLDAVAQRSGKLITHITNQTRKAIVESVRDAFLDGHGVPKDRIFSILEHAANIRNDLGLNQRQMAALRKYRYNLKAQGYTGQQYQKLADRYRWKLLKQRASMIARTETIEAACEGQRLAWGEAVGEGYIDQDNWEVEWIVTPDDITCPNCLTMKKARRPINGLYSTGRGAGTNGPTLHPNCRCGERLVKKKNLIRPTLPRAA